MDCYLGFGSRAAVGIIVSMNNPCMLVDKLNPWLDEPHTRVDKPHQRLDKPHTRVDKPHQLVDTHNQRLDKPDRWTEKLHRLLKYSVNIVFLHRQNQRRPMSC